MNTHVWGRACRTRSKLPSKQASMHTSPEKHTISMLPMLSWSRRCILPVLLVQFDFSFGLRPLAAVSVVSVVLCLASLSARHSCYACRASLAPQTEGIPQDMQSIGICRVRRARDAKRRGSTQAFSVCLSPASSPVRGTEPPFCTGLMGT